MKTLIARATSRILEQIAGYFVQTASPISTYRPEVPAELKK